MKSFLFIGLIYIIVHSSIFLPSERYLIHYFKAISLSNQEGKFKVGVKQLGLFYINPDIENIEVVSKDTLLLKGKLHNDNLAFDLIEVYLLKKYIQRSFPFIKKREIYKQLYKIADVNADGQFEARLCIRDEALLFIGGGNNTLDHIGLSISEIK